MTKSKIGAVVNELNCKLTLRTLGIADEHDWHHWMRAHRTRRLHLALPADPVQAYGNTGFWFEMKGQHPRAWSSFQKRLKASKMVISAEALEDFGQFAARYRLASGFRGVRISGMKSDTISGYSAALGVFLAYSALEACCIATGSKVSRKSVYDIALSDRIRRACKVSISRMLKEVENARLLKGLVSFQEGNTDDILPFAAAVRHLIAHGSFTAWGIGVTSFRSILVFQELSEALLRHSDDLFRRHLTNHLAQS